MKLAAYAIAILGALVVANAQSSSTSSAIPNTSATSLVASAAAPSSAPASSAVPAVSAVGTGANSTTLAAIINSFSQTQQDCMMGEACSVSASKCFTQCFNGSTEQVSNARSCLIACPSSITDSEGTTTIRPDECTNGCFIEFYQDIGLYDPKNPPSPSSQSSSAGQLVTAGFAVPFLISALLYAQL
ncbi:hypothetical protein IWQ60_000081 [Tieghemiomyces parasiticus]|uniref:Uncharacterized protein n=1 Tax=Tieghemiomyces parasiticus TaxID=78921 RepID=A0A9W8DXY6_9FUNG|nr:hypothetical protein IWQ60_000081 [Tieghemiomyces parasiticus]